VPGEDEDDAQLLLFGGQTNDDFSADVLAVQLATGEVRHLEPSSSDAPRPSARGAASAVLLPDGRHVLLTGGGTAVRDARDAWIFDVPARTWSAVALPNAEPFEVKVPGKMAGLDNTLFGRQTLVMTVPPAQADGSVAVVVWGGNFLVRGQGAAADDVHAGLHNGISVMRLAELA
jgi:hypothetical protein